MKTGKRYWLTFGLPILLTAALFFLAVADMGLCAASSRSDTSMQRRPAVGTSWNGVEAFEPNRGQVDRRAEFLSRGRDYTLFLTRDEVVIALKRPKDGPPTGDGGQRAVTDFVGFRFVDSHVTGLSAEGRLPGKVNYIVGDKPAAWLSGLPMYEKVSYRDVYPGVNVIFYGVQAGFECDLIVHPHADPDAICFEVTGTAIADIDPEGNLVLASAGGQVILKAPRAYQDVDGVRKTVPAWYVLKEKSRIGFAVAAYDKKSPLVIDPVFVYSSYLGGAGEDVANAIAVDGEGNAYVAGYTTSVPPLPPPFPPPLGADAVTGVVSLPGGGQDAVVAKLSADGSSVAYITYLGGSSSEFAKGLAVDAQGCAYVTGYTASSDFPTTSGAIQRTYGGNTDAFITKLNPGGAPAYSTYLGGPSEEAANAIAVDSNGNAYVTGHVLEGPGPTSFPTTAFALQTSHGGGNWDAFISKLNPTGSTLVYSTYLGGASRDVAHGIAVDGEGNAYIAGETSSWGFPGTNVGSYQQYCARGSSGACTVDGFVVKIDPAGSSLTYSTYLGGTGFDIAYAVAVDSTGSAHVTGETRSSDFPLVRLARTYRGEGDAFVSKFNANGSGVYYSFWLGGTGNDIGRSVALDNTNKAVVAGFTNSPDFGAYQDGPQAVFGGNGDAFVVRVEPTGPTIELSTYIGGSGYDDATGIAVGPDKSIFVTGRTNSANFPVVGPVQPYFGGGSGDAFVTKISDFLPILEVTIDIKPGTFPNTVNLGSGGTLPVAILSSTNFDACTIDPTSVHLASASVKLKGQGTPMASCEDVNKDGLRDLLVHVTTEALQITTADMKAVLGGRTFGGVRVSGTDTIRVVP